jgi:hypothetical protein
MSDILKKYFDGWCFEKLSEFYNIPVQQIKKIIYREELKYFR